MCRRASRIASSKSLHIAIFTDYQSNVDLASICGFRGRVAKYVGEWKIVPNNVRCEQGVKDIPLCRQVCEQVQTRPRAHPLEGFIHKFVFANCVSWHRITLSTHLCQTLAKVPDSSTVICAWSNWSECLWTVEHWNGHHVCFIADAGITSPTAHLCTHSNTRCQDNF